MPGSRARAAVARATARAAERRQFLRVIAHSTVAQVLTQAVQFVTGVLIVRMLSKADYGAYTLAMTLVPALAVVATSGVLSAIQSTAGPRMSDDAHVSRVFGAALWTTRRATSGLVLAGPPLAWILLRRHLGDGEAAIAAALVTALAAAQVWLQPTTGYLQLRARYGVSQWYGLMAVSGRTLLIAAALVVGLRNLPTVLAITLVSSLALLWLWRDLFVGVVSSGDRRRPAAEARRPFRTAARRLAPGTVYWAVQGQLLVFLLSVLGETERLAEVGALGRYAQLFAVPTTVAAFVLVPRYARVPGDDAALRKGYGLLVAAFGVGTAAAGLLALATAPLLLALLGPAYGGLHAELVVLLLGAGFGATIGVMHQLNLSRGWTRGQWLGIPASVAWSAALISVLDFSVLMQAVLFTALAPLPALGLLGWQALRGMREARGVPPVA